MDVSSPSAGFHLKPGLALILGVAAVSSAAVLISLARAHGIPALWIAALRLSIAAAVVAPVAIVRGRQELRGLTRKDWLLGLASGGFLALHFGFWTSSLDSTSVMSSVVFVSTNPLFVALASLLLLRERVRGATAAGIAAATAGGVIVGLTDVAQAGAASTRGDVLALLAAVCGSAYLLAGRRLRSRMSLAVYVGIVYVTAAVALLAAAAVSGAPLAPGASAASLPASAASLPASADWTGFLWIALLALGPQLIGHTSYNYALKFVSATLVTVTLLAEPIGATLLAIPVLGQVPSWQSAAGAILILVGIALAARAEAPAPLPRSVETESGK